MAKITKKDWELWKAERKDFVQRESEGFTKDLAALETHIKAIQEFAPKDAAGWPVSAALRVIEQLQRDYHRIKTLVALIKSPY